jgi:hypothetical protein
VFKQVSWAAALLIGSIALAEPQVPDKLLGIWATDDSTLKGETLVRGGAIYVDIDGVGAMVMKRGSDTSVTRLTVTGYAESTHQLEVDITERGGVTGHLTLNYDESQMALVPADNPADLYHRRAVQMSPVIRQALGLEPATLSVPPIRR